MNIMIVGSGGRESAFAWAISKSPRVQNVYIVPGNGGTLKYGENILIDVVYPFDELVRFVDNADVDLTIVGPEAPLVNGIVDVFRNLRLPILGPTKKAARLEGSKVFMKQFMQKHGIPTANFAIFDDADTAMDYVESRNIPFVIKTNGLAAGKGAIVNKTVDETLSAISRMMIRREFGMAGDKIIIEDILEGEEISVFIMADGKHFKWLASAQDHKRIFDLDEGPNTGGMGAYAPAPFLNDRMKDVIIGNIIMPTLRGMQMEGCPYTGILYIGLMLTKSGPCVIEYNVRFGDPEAQVVLPLLKSDFVEIAEATVNQRLNELKIRYYDGYCCGVVMASEGYPGNYPKGYEINGDLDDEVNRFVFHAGTKRRPDGKLVTSGGRVLCVSALGSTLASAIDNTYAKVNKIDFDGAYFRKDIGRKGLRFLGLV